MSEDRLITVAIHTYEHAVQLKNLLESEGVPVVLHNVNLIPSGSVKRSQSPHKRGRPATRVENHREH